MDRAPLLPPDWPVLSALLDEALALPLGERSKWVESLGAEHAERKETLKKLLATGTGDFLDTLPKLGEAVGSQDALCAGQEIGPYRLLRQIGAGGMGAVWLAERADGSLKRKVALKLPRASWSRGMVDRMACERDILASLEHPYISRLYDAGTDTEGRPFLALEYVEGEPIDVYCRQRALTIKARLQLLLQAAQAVAFAHSRLVVHRDLKPSNILVTAEGQVRLLDFGIAKLMEGDRAEESLLTQLAGRPLTLDYASPEQIRGEQLGTASDVYSLGVVSFELLAGAKPYKLKRHSAAELEEAIAQTDAPLASTVATDPDAKRDLRGDLDAILNKALKKSIAERYPSVDALALDWNRYLDGHRVLARPDSLTYRVARFVSRHRSLLASVGAAGGVLAIGIGFGAAVLVAVVLAGGLVASLHATRRAMRQRDRAAALARRNAAVNVFLDLLLTRNARAGPLTVDQLLQRSEALIATEVESDPEHRAYVFGVLASCHQSLGYLTQAERIFANAHRIAQRGSDTELIDALTSRHALTQGVLGATLEAMERIEAVIKRSRSPNVLCEAHHARSVLASRADDHTVALQHAYQALQWFRSARDMPASVEAALLGNLGWALHAKGESEEADLHYSECLRIYKRLGMEDSPEYVNWIQDYAYALQDMGDASGSVRLFDLALALSRRAGRHAPTLVYARADRAYALAEMGRFEEAKAGYLEALAASRLPGPMLTYVPRGRPRNESADSCQACSPGALATFYIRMCLVELYVDQGLCEAATIELRHAEEELGSDAPNYGETCLAHILARARLNLLQGHPAEAVQTVTAALVPDGLAPAGVRSTSLLLARGESYLALGQLDIAEEDAKAAEALARRLQGRRPASFRTGLALLMRARIEVARGERELVGKLASEALAQLTPTLAPTHPAFAAVTRMMSTGSASAQLGS
jgi:eukaryotic-like serine/threonine-protein kinase